MSNSAICAALSNAFPSGAEGPVSGTNKPTWMMSRTPGGGMSSTDLATVVTGGNGRASTIADIGGAGAGAVDGGTVVTGAGAARGRETWGAGAWGRGVTFLGGAVAGLDGGPPCHSVNSSAILETCSHPPSAKNKAKSTAVIRTGCNPAIGRGTGGTEGPVGVTDGTRIDILR